MRVLRTSPIALTILPSVLTDLYVRVGDLAWCRLGRTGSAPRVRLGDRDGSWGSSSGPRKPTFGFVRGVLDAGQRRDRYRSLGPPTVVGSRAGAVLRRDGLAVDSPFPLGVPHEPPREPVSCPCHLKRSMRISRTPLSCRLHRTGNATYRDGIAARSTQRHVCRRDAPRGSDSAFPEQYSRRRSVLQTTERHYQPLLPPPFLTTPCRQQGPFARRALPRVRTTTAPSATRSSPRRFPGGSGYTTGLPPGPFALGRDGLLQLLGVSYCLRAAGSTPPMEPDASASVRQSLLPSPPTVGLGPRHWRFSRHHRRSLALRPGHSLAIPWMTWSIGFSSVGFPSGCYPSYGALALTPVGLTPTEHTCLIWTHPSAPAPEVRRAS